MVWSLAKERLIPARFAKTNFRGVPVWAVLFSMAGSLLALLSSVIAASTVYLVLVAVSGLATLVVWFSVCVCHIRFRREWARDGHSADELGYRAPGFPVLPWLAIVMCIGALVLVVLDDTQRSTPVLHDPVRRLLLCGLLRPRTAAQTRKERLTRFRGADSAFAGGLSPFQGADAQVGKALKWRYVVATKPFILAVRRLNSPSKAK